MVQKIEEISVQERVNNYLMIIFGNQAWIVGFGDGHSTNELWNQYLLTYADLLTKLWNKKIHAIEILFVMFKVLLQKNLNKTFLDINI